MDSAFFSEARIKVTIPAIAGRLVRTPLGVMYFFMFLIPNFSKAKILFQSLFISTLIPSILPAGA
jgi:hypothetical protein